MSYGIEPKCSADEHDWQEPHCLLGGNWDNPGVRGHGAGIISRSICIHCGCERVTDTWAQNRVTGEQGLTSVSYETDAWNDDQLARARQELGIEIENDEEEEEEEEEEPSSPPL